jgi:hypothetical protein
MKKIMSLFLLLTLVQAQVMAVTLPAGTPVHIKPIRTVDADKHKLGELVKFEVIVPVKVNEKTVIKPTTTVTGKVIKHKNNCIIGVPGHIEVGNFAIQTEKGKEIFLNGTIYDEGNNRYWSNVGWIFLFPLLLIKGDDGKIQMNTHHILYTLEDVNL